MIKKTVTYTDYNEVERTEDFYFNLNKAEVTELELGTTGGFAAMLQKIIDAKDQPTIIRVFKDIVFKAYGVKSSDGRQFEKSEALSKAFSQTEAYSNIFMELAFNAKAASEFVKGIIPSDLDKTIAKIAEDNKKDN